MIQISCDSIEICGTTITIDRKHSGTIFILLCERTTKANLDLFDDIEYWQLL